MSFSQCLLFIVIVVVCWVLIDLITTRIRKSKSRLNKAEREELTKIAYEMSCVFTGKNILQQFLVQVSESLTKQEIITHLANSIKICNNNGEVPALDLTTSNTTDDYTEHARIFYETIIEKSKEKQKGNTEIYDK